MKIIILDRDGTLNQLGEEYITTPAEWQAERGALEAVARLNHGGWHVVLATNQPGLGRGLFDAYTLNEMHAKMNALLTPLGGRVDAVFFCPHAPEDDCRCRKPRPGLFEDIGLRFGIDMAGVPAVGDTLRDLQAASTVGCTPHLVRTGKAASLDEAGVQAMREKVPGLTVHADLAAFVDALLAAEGRRAADGRRA